MNFTSILASARSLLSNPTTTGAGISLLTNLFGSNKKKAAASVVTLLHSLQVTAILNPGTAPQAVTNTITAIEQIPYVSQLNIDDAVAGLAGVSGDPHALSAAVIQIETSLSSLVD